MNARISAKGRNRQTKLVIGLVNNMGAGGLAACRDQFAAALQGTGRAFELRHLTLRDAADAGACTPINGTPDDDVDALIVTGMEPAADDLRQEWLWPRLVQLHDWAEERLVPVIWSCLSAHAAALHSHQVQRRRLDAKFSGVFECRRAIAHPLLRGLPQRWAWPHSRLNGLPEPALAAAGFTVLSRAGAEVDIFMRADGTPFFYFQGHPEYREDTLLREYLRDARRFASSETATRPAVPSGYFNTEGECLLAACDDAAALLPGTAKSDWRPMQRRLFANWIDIACAHAGRRLTPPAAETWQDAAYLENRL